MKNTSILYSSILALSLISINGCAATQHLRSDAKKLSKNYQHVTKLAAYIDSEKSLHLCVDLLKEGSAKPVTISQHIPWNDFEIMSFTTLIYTGEGYIFDARKYLMGCEVRADFTPIHIAMIDIDLVIRDYNSEYNQYMSNLPTLDTEYSLYLLNTEKFKITTGKCGDKVCRYDMTYSWPRLVIKAKTKNKRPPVSILAGHADDKKGYSPAQAVKAAAIDVITFPFQAIILGWYVLFGAK